MKIINKKIAKKKSSAAWVRRQLSDPYVERAHKEGFRARAAYKLSEIDEKFHIFKDGQTVVDLGAAPGSWAQYVAKNFPHSRVLAIDLLPIKPVKNAEIYMGDFSSDAAHDWLSERTKDGVDVVLPDMAPNTTGHRGADHLRQTALLEYALEFAKERLKPGGTFVAKSFAGGTLSETVETIKRQFVTVRHVKPNASRKASVELFLVAMGFKKT